jgi:serine phosphatase RsbU (regulator of sigma subunit)
MGRISGTRRCVLLLRESGSEPFEDVDLDFLHRVADDIRQAVAGAEARTQDTRISQALQSGMRNELQKVDGVMARALYSSATAAAFVGGDFYDLIRLPDRRACVILGDVSGKGVEAASVSAAVKTALGAYAWEGLPPAHMVRSLNDFLLGFSRLETFATLFVGLVDLEAATLTYCSAGHPPAMLLRASTHELQTLDVQSGVVGAFREMTYRDGVISLERGDLLLLYTDGVTEARGPKGDFFGEDGLSEALMRETQRGTDGLLDRLLQTLDTFTDRHLDDDVAMMSLRFDELGPVSD